MINSNSRTPAPASARASLRLALFATAWLLMVAGGLMESLPVTFSGGLLLILSVMIELDHVTSQPRPVRVRAGRGGR